MDAFAPVSSPNGFRSGLTNIPYSRYFKAMPRPTKYQPESGDARTRLLNAAMDAIRQKGFSATSVDDLCKRAGVSKGAYFHHFKSKEDVGVAAADHWSAVASDIFRTAPYHDAADPADRLIAYVDFRKAIIQGDLADFTCLVGTMAQETFESYPAIRDACGASITGHAETLEADIAEAISQSALDVDWTPIGLATHIQAVIQGSFVVAKATNNSAAAVESLDHLKRYLELLFHPKATEAARNDK
ncbi:TetR/AcrR family transcriptional regulator [Yoonia sp. F2084L]|uniref:TetR/AcrR family transcriptional regulator n=1 Tax=Yoonia sp. F2084L TaxID=2926419 RepID=UPI001FF1042F|nr:TetR/AcrR family transcriptional regulator [Yoonia sp. F2084L]MCK0095214.1 TetR/AcrR family transcriptional regulator [Yoonia sp. F2084L]